MAGNRPFFITGANAKIKVNGKTMAFCSDLSYSVQVLTQTPKVLGMYEGSSVEPLGYNVSGSFTIIRYTKDAVKNVGSTPQTQVLVPPPPPPVIPPGLIVDQKPTNVSGPKQVIIPQRPIGVAQNDAGNGVGNWGSAWTGTGNPALASDGRANEALDPSRFADGTTFDIQVYQKTPNGDIGVANIRNVRITQADFSISKRSAAVQKFNFVALYVDEDSFVADFSGIGQQF